MSKAGIALQEGSNWGCWTNLIVLGYILAAAMGVVLGLLGGGGSILTVPILAYLMAVPKDHAPSYSLFVVGVVSTIGAVQYVRQKQFSYKAAILFGIPSMVAVYVNQRFIRPAIPETLTVMGTQVSRGAALMGLFAVMMLLAAWSMVRKKNRQTPDTFELNTPEALRPAKAMLAGLLEGFLTGLVGAGGGFIIVPALVSIAKLPMKKAVGTSLIIMAVKSLVGFSGALHDLDVDWAMLLPFTGIAAVGIVVGALLQKKVTGPNLKLAFGWFVLVMGVIVVLKTLLDP